MKRSTLLTISLFLGMGIAFSAPMLNVPMVLFQPDGTEIRCLASGDEFHNWLHDADGFTIVQSPETGFYVYALQDGEQVKPSTIVVGSIEPLAAGLKKNVNLSPRVVEEKRRAFEEKMVNTEIKGFNTKKGTGALSNIIIFIKFNDETPPPEEFNFYSNLYEAESEDAYSLFRYYKDASYNRLEMNSTYLPAPSGNFVVWHSDSNPRNFYRPYNATTNPIGYDPDASSGANSRVEREHTLLKNAINAVKSALPPDFNVDANNDGYVDCVSFIISGGPDGWNELLWPHRWALYTVDVRINSKRVWDFSLQLQYTDANQTTRLRLATVAHEMFHVVGAPDLYRYYNNTINPVGVWDLMASTSYLPQNTTAYMKYLYGGWIDKIPNIAESGTYTLNRLDESSQNCFRIPSGKTHTEYYVVEYRSTSGKYDNVLPAPGLLVYRINDRNVGAGNANGPPDELYIFRPNGNSDNDGTINSASFSSETGRTSFNSSTSSYPFLSDGTVDDIKIFDVGSALGNTITFSVDIDYEYQRAMKFYKQHGFNGFNPTYNGTNIPVAIKLTPDELSPFVNQFISKVEFVVCSGSGSGITLKIWRGTENNSPKDLIYSKDVSGEVVFNNYTLHQLTAPIQIEDGVDFWVGYEINSTGYGSPFGVDYGYMELGKGGWVKHQETWKPLTEISSSYDFNLLISAIIQNLQGVDIESGTLQSEPVRATSYPNPFGQSTTISYSLQSRAQVRIKLFNILGQELSTLLSAVQDAGEHTLEVMGSELPSGVYFYRVELNGQAAGAVTKKMIKQ